MMDPFVDLRYPESRVLIIITGGTICMRPSEQGLIPATGFLKSGLAPRPSFNDGSYPEPLEIVVDDKSTRKAVQSLRTPVSAYDRRIRYCVLEFETLLDSSSIDAAGWDKIAKSVHRNYQLFDGFVVLHGTDSLAYTCSALSFMLQNLGKPVILTGSQAPMLTLQNDATDNLLGSLVIAGHFMVPEVCLFFDNKLFRGNRATKVSASAFHAFESPNHPPLAEISSLRTEVQWNLVYRPTVVSSFSLALKLDTAHVSCLRVFPGIKPEMLDAVLRIEGLKGLVLETFGAGNAPGGPDSAFVRVLADAVRRGIVIVNVTQCLSGSVSPLYAPGTALGQAGVVFGQDMTTEAALTKLSYLLALPDATPEGVAKQMSVSLRGELTETSRTHFQHPNGSLTPKMTALTALGYAIGAGNLAGVRDVMRGEPEWLLNDVDYSGNTPMHLAATGPSVDVLREFLSQGASVHLRNRQGHTPLYLAAAAGLAAHARLLLDAGAHLHLEEMAAARLQAGAAAGRKAAGGKKAGSRQRAERARVWRMVGVGVEEEEDGEDGDVDAEAEVEERRREGDGVGAVGEGVGGGGAATGDGDGENGGGGAPSR
ncbi:asparaginase-domain-containing protein [Lineolata rhizophorae]|uniref:asparaginase n=1 Tax=Lineolata rhizophorae TaxID=578093 RepID=A0A6A6NUU1_9PEZI|nr:asparaginase-domain-containing protein [Lineolata rhizophorae]